MNLLGCFRSQLDPGWCNFSTSSSHDLHPHSHTKHTSFLPAFLRGLPAQSVVYLVPTHLPAPWQQLPPPPAALPCTWTHSSVFTLDFCVCVSLTNFTFAFHLSGVQAFSVHVYICRDATALIPVCVTHRTLIRPTDTGDPRPPPLFSVPP